LRTEILNKIKGVLSTSLATKQYYWFRLLSVGNGILVKSKIFKALFPKQALLFIYIQIYFSRIDYLFRKNLCANIQNEIKYLLIKVGNVPYLAFRGFVRLENNLGFWSSLLFHRQKVKAAFKKTYILPQHSFPHIKDSKFIKEYPLATYKMSTYEYKEEENRLGEKLETHTKFFYYEIEDAILTGTGYIIPQAVKFEYFFTNKLFEDIDKQIFEEIKTISITPACIPYPKAIFLNPPSCNNYYHWLIETLSHFKDLNENEELLDVPLVVTTEMPSQHYEPLELLAKNSNRKIIWINKVENIKVKKLYLLTNPAYLPEYLGRDHYNYCKISPAHLTYMRNKILEE